MKTINAIYCRVSTDSQAERGYSIADQLRTCREHADKLNLANIVEYVDDGYSGEFLERPALDRLRDDLRAKLINNVIVYDPDRLSRNLTNQLLIADEIEKSGTRLHFVTGDYDASPEGRLFFSIRGAIAAFEKAKIRERTLRGKRSKALSGKLIQNDNAYGYDWDAENSTYTINEAEAAIIRMIYDLYLSQNYSIRKIALLFRQQEIFNRQGKYITMSMIHRILTDEKYAGTKWVFRKYEKKVSQYKRQKTIRDQSEWIPVEVPAIVSVEQFNQAKQILASKRLNSPRNTRRQYLLRGFIRCEVCGYAMQCHSKKYKSGREYSWYKCSSGNTDKQIMPCGNPATSSVELDDAAWKQLCKAAKSKKSLAAILKQDEITDSKDQLERLSHYHDELKKKQSTIVKWFRDGMIQSEDAEKELASINKEIQATAIAIANLSTETKKPATISPDEILAAKTFEERRAIIEKLGYTVYIDNREDTAVLKFKL